MGLRAVLANSLEGANMSYGTFATFGSWPYQLHTQDPSVIVGLMDGLQETSERPNNTHLGSPILPPPSRHKSLALGPECHKLESKAHSWIVGSQLGQHKDVHWA